MLAWGSHVSQEFRDNVRATCRFLSIDPSWLMACMAFETGETFNPTIRNAAGSGAVGLIQFMPTTASALGTTVEGLAGLHAEDQLYYVQKYFTPWAGHLKSLGDVYGAIIWPGMIGRPDSDVVFDQADPKHPKLYIQNRGLDFNKDGKITKAEIVSRIQRELDLGLQPINVST